MGSVCEATGRHQRVRLGFQKITECFSPRLAVAECLYKQESLSPVPISNSINYDNSNTDPSNKNNGNHFLSYMPKGLLSVLCTLFH